VGNTSIANVTVVSAVTWGITAISIGGNPGQYLSLALDSTGKPQIAYYNTNSQGTQKIARYNGSSWSSQTVDGTHKTGSWNSLALDGSGNGRVSYYDSGANQLKFATYNGSSWSKQVSDDGGTGHNDVGQYSSLVLDSSGNARISYYDATAHALKYVAQTGPTTWATPMVVDNAVGTWATGSFTSISLDPTAGHQPRIAYYDAAAHQLKFASFDGSAWTTQAVPGADGQYGSLALESTNGYARISFYDRTSHWLKYVEQTGTSTWNAAVTVDSSGDVGQSSSLALDSSSNPRIACYDATNKNLKCALGFGGAWDIQTVDTGGASDVGQGASLRLDPATGKVRIAYWDASAQALKYASQQ
jgi:hypothetical protein